MQPRHQDREGRLLLMEAERAIVDSKRLLEQIKRSSQAYQHAQDKMLEQIADAWNTIKLTIGKPDGHAHLK